MRASFLRGSLGCQPVSEALPCRYELQSGLELERSRLVRAMRNIAWLDRIVFWRSLLQGLCLAGVLLVSAEPAEAADLRRFLSPANLPKRAKWHHAYSKAVAEAKKTQRPIMLLFTGEEWCKPCQYLERKVFMKNEFHEWAIKSVVLARVNLSREFKPTVFNIFERKSHENLLKKYRMRTIPSAIMLTPGEQPLGVLRFSGQTAREYVAAAQRIIQRRKPSIGKSTL